MGPDFAEFKASSTCSGLTKKALMSLSQPSAVSVTSGQVLLHLPFDDGIPYYPNAVGVRNSDRSFEKAPFLQPG
jgi:hypothetical protein